MSLAANVANKSIREAISTIATTVDELEAKPQVSVEALTAAVNELKEQVRQLNIVINGDPSKNVGGTIAPPL